MIRKAGVVSKESPFATSDNIGIYDVIAEDLRVLYEGLSEISSSSELVSIRDEIKDLYTQVLTDDKFSSTAAKESAKIAKEQAEIVTKAAKEISDKITALQEENSDTADFLVELRETVTNIKKYLSDMELVKKDISDGAKTAKEDASSAKASATEASKSEANAKDYAAQAQKSADNAKTSETNALTSEQTSKKHKEAIEKLLLNLDNQVSTAKGYADYVKKFSEGLENYTPPTPTPVPTTTEEGSLTFSTMDAFVKAKVECKVGDKIRLLGYYRANDGGGADYICGYVPSITDMPWAILLGETKELEYKIKKDINGTPILDEKGEYALEKDSSGQPIPVLDDKGNQVHKKLYALLDEKVVNYRMFGAKLDGKTDDYNAIRMAHRYQSYYYNIEPMSLRKHYYIKVENHEGIIRKDNNEPIQCCGNIDLSGSELLVQDCNATWFGFYLWGDNETDYMTYEPTEAAKATYKKDNFVINTQGNLSHLDSNAIIFLKEEPYAVRDDAGYLYSEPRYELLLHTLDGVLANPITYDWDSAGGLEIKSSVSNYNTHAASTQTVNSQFTISYNMLPSTHYEFVGCNVKLATSANKYCSVLWCKCHNAHVRGFNFYPDSKELHNTVFKNTMIYIWGCYNTEVSDIVGFNSAGKMQGSSNGTSGYMIRATNCLNLHIHDVSMQGYWGATAMNCVKEVHIERVNANRLDIHNYFHNLYIDHCNLFNHAIQIGEGRGICQITNSNFYVNDLPNDSYPNAHILEFNTTYGRIFEGRVLIENCNAWLKKPADGEFDVCKIDFNAEAVSTLDSHRFPDITIRDCYFHSYENDTYLVYLMVAGKRNCRTAGQAPTTVANQSKDTGNDDKGSLVWRYLGRGIDWTEGSYSGNGNVVKGQFIRTFEKTIDASGKTTFFNTRVFVVTQAGTIPAISESTKPSDTSGKEFALGTAKVKYVEWYEWQSNKDYSVGDYCYTSESFWLPLHCWECISAGHSNGWRPVHTSGKVIEGEDVYPKNLDACFWQYVNTKNNFVTKHFSPDLQVSKGEILYADHRLYKVIESGRLPNIPPVDTAWHGSFDWGTARLGFIGKDWARTTWWEKNSYCISVSKDGTECVYQLVDQDGTTSGRVPIKGNPRCVDGDIIWEWISSSAQGSEWRPNTSYNLGDVVHVDNNSYKCVFDGKLEMPSQIVLQNISTNMTSGGDVFAFWEKGTDIPTKCNNRGKWTIKVENVDLYRFRKFSKGYFGRTDNALPTTIEINENGTKVTIPDQPIPTPTPTPEPEPTPTPTPEPEPTPTPTPSTDKPSTDTPTPTPSPSTTPTTGGGNVYHKMVSITSDKAEDWSGGSDYQFTVPAGHNKVLLKATSDNGATISPSSYLCFIDPDWNVQEKVSITDGVVVDCQAGKTYCFCYWFGTNKACNINIDVSASAEVDAMTSSTAKIPVYK